MNLKSTSRRLSVSLIALFALLLIATGCGGKQKEDSTLGGPDTSGDNPIVTIEMDSGKTIKVELYPKIAPNTVNNFISLVNKGFYDGTIFHRVIPGFMIQGGDPDGTGMGGPGYSIEGEFTQNGFQNDLKHTTGVLSMARAQNPNSAGSQFFIMVADSPHLDGAYASFGKVIEGIEVAQEIVNTPRGASDRPKTPQVMKKVTVDTRGAAIPEPEIIQ
ncbi:peptidylprolyl isomerase [Cohnella sp. CIP 111063]|jgi:peptidyl-prolyl cis-trans isomerase B (cyclophilin B)|uniref:peptidylprolyl isomerase n=1 Tax=unclassified Cohnella TaxID=2636738 RepID=UPI000B8C24F4|nr:MULTISPECIES: peptidylprolyl isomerase [unclassified Cohnella]OXS60452.1 peptidylprolyl isomerase [Cohnella sp. CIP 111063]